MKNLLANLKRKSKRVTKDRQILKQVAILQQSGDEPTQRIGNVITRTHLRQLSAAERALVEHIEKARMLMQDSAQRLDLVDHNGQEFTRTVAEATRISKGPLAALLLFQFVREFRPQQCLELGTNVGISAAYQGAALHLNRSGSLTTLDVQQSKIKVAEAVFNRLQLKCITTEQGWFDNTLGRMLGNGLTYQYVFIDGHHDEQATLGYFDRIYPYLSTSALVVFDDIAWSEGMRRAWTSLLADRRLPVCVDLGKMGVCLALDYRLSTPMSYTVNLL